MPKVLVHAERLDLAAGDGRDRSPARLILKATFHCGCPVQAGLSYTWAECQPCAMYSSALHTTPLFIEVIEQKGDLVDGTRTDTALVALHKFRPGHRYHLTVHLDSGRGTLVLTVGSPSAPLLTETPGAALAALEEGPWLDLAKARDELGRVRLLRANPAAESDTSTSAEPRPTLHDLLPHHPHEMTPKYFWSPTWVVETKVRQIINAKSREEFLQALASPGGDNQRDDLYSSSIDKLIPITKVDDIQRLLYVSRFAMAAYGKAFLYMTTLPNMIFHIHLRGLKMDEDSVSQAHEVSTLTGLPSDCIVDCDYRASPFSPAWFLAVDHEAQCIILSVRGTITLDDFATDADADADIFPPDTANLGLSSGPSLASASSHNGDGLGQSEPLPGSPLGSTKSGFQGECDAAGLAHSGMSKAAVNVFRGCLRTVQ
eukprot:gene2131-482_t